MGFSKEEIRKKESDKLDLYFKIVDHDNTLPFLLPFATYPYQPIEKNEQNSLLTHLFNENDRVIRDEKDPNQQNKGIHFLNRVIFFLQANTPVPEHTFLSHEEVAKNLRLNHYMAIYADAINYPPQWLSHDTINPGYTLMNYCQSFITVKNPTLLLIQLLIPSLQNALITINTLDIKRIIQKYPNTIITDSLSIIRLLRKYDGSIRFGKQNTKDKLLLIFQVLLRPSKEFAKKFAQDDSLSEDLKVWINGDQDNFFNQKSVVNKQPEPQVPLPQPWFKKTMPIKGLLIVSGLCLLWCFLKKYLYIA